MQTKNETGSSPMDSIQIFAGKKVPAAVKDLSLTMSNTGLATLSWTAPVSGLHSRAFDVATLNYKVIRYPGNVIVKEGLTATTYNDQITQGKYDNYCYTVIACTNKLEGGSTLSDYKLYGDAYNAPFTETFDSNQTEFFQAFTIEDADKDNDTWEFGSKEIKCGGTNDWLFTPSIKLGTENVYKLTFKMRSFSNNSSSSIKVTLGNAANSAAQTIVLLDLNEVAIANNTEYNVIIKAASAGNYNIGFHVYGGLTAYLDDISIAPAASLQAPARITDCKIKAAPKGELKATLSFNTPAKKYNGEILRNCFDFIVL